MHIHLDAVGGVAGDMFIAALLDAFPEHRQGMLESIHAVTPPKDVTLSIEAHRDHALTGLRFDVSDGAAAGAGKHHHTTFREIRQRLDFAPLAESVYAKAIDIFTLLARAESRVHGQAEQDVSFHELGAWDSIADIVGAAHLIAQSDASWSVSPLPLGRGGIQSAHGYLPVPAPATVELLQGFECFDDGVEGERVTPTGAAILKHVDARQTRDRRPRTLARSGTGFGRKVFPGLSNILRVLVFEERAGTISADRIAEILFEVDDQTPEDLAIGLDNLRRHPAVKDVLQMAAFGKKGRLTAHIRVLADPLSLQDVIETCLSETSTIGLRFQVLDRSVLPRRQGRIDAAGRSIDVKISERAEGNTVKAEADDLANVVGGRSARDKIRRAAEDSANEKDTLG